MPDAGGADGGDWPREWARSVTLTVASQIRRHLERRKMSVTQLASACRIPRPVMSNLLNGQRETVSVAELFVIARALQVPPILLVLPIGEAEDLEIFPSTHRPTIDVAHWLRGDLVLDPDLSPTTETQGLYAWLRVHRLIPACLRDQQSGDMDEAALARRETLRVSYESLQPRYGIAPPPLPPGLTLEDEEIP